MPETGDDGSRPPAKRAGRPRTPVLGLCRFSYPSGEDGMARRIGGRDLAERCAVLYGPKRLDERMFLFERVFLPPWRRQTDPNFSLAVLLGERFPEPYRSRLEALVRDVPQIRLEYRPEGRPMVATCREVTLGLRPSDDRLVAEFRLDDDDAVSVDYVRRVRGLVKSVRPLLRRRSALLSFARGLYLDFSEGRLTRTPVMVPYWTPGLTYVWPATTDKIFASYLHTNAWTKMVSIVVPGRPMFIRSGHDGNISGIASADLEARGARPIRAAEEERVFRERFGIDVEALAGDWSALSRRK